MKTVILAGGLGTRLREETEYRPKPMVPIGTNPILWHIMRTYAHFNYKDFVICVGYKGESIKEYFRDFASLNLDFTIKIGKNSVLESHGSLEEEGWNVTVANTGAETMTGGRIFKIRKYLNNETFFCTYGDGVSNVNIEELINFHREHGKIATMTAVKPVTRFGALEIGNNGQVNNFFEKPQSDGWVNAGFFVFEPEIFNYLKEDSILENEPLARLVIDGQLAAFKHTGFWQPMDTFRETQILNELWVNKNAPWKVWE